jgi:hypothetical protein
VAFISKTDYVLWRACPKNAWLRIYRPEIYYAAELTEFERFVIDMGSEVECVARGLFPGGVLVPGAQEEARENTIRHLAAHTGTLFQAVFERSQLLAAIDVLERNVETGEYSVFEIKSSTKAEKEHLYDLAFQVLLLRQCSLSVCRTGIIHLNPDYVRRGELDIQRLFRITDLTAEVDLVSETVIREMEQARVLAFASLDPNTVRPFIIRTRTFPVTAFTISPELAAIRKN